MTTFVGDEIDTINTNFDVRQMSDISGRMISLGHGLADIPERLLLAHARGEVLFIAGAGISQPAGFPDFRGLVLKVYAALDGGVYDVISVIPPGACNHWNPDLSRLTAPQAAEAKRFIQGDYDVVLGMLERRMDGTGGGKSKVRRQIVEELMVSGIRPAPIHRVLMQLADRGAAIAIVTTNFDLLLENSIKKHHPAIQTYALGGIPRPGRRNEFAGVLHIHGALDSNPKRFSDIIVSDQDFGEFYLRRRAVPDFIYDAARLFNIVLVGYSANDPPMRYLLNAVAADGVRFDDLKERYTFVGMTSPDPVTLEDWKGRGITPIVYDASNQHGALLNTLERWAKLSAINGKKQFLDAELRRIVQKSRANATGANRDLFEHFVRRSNPKDRVRIAKFISEHKADIDWLDTITAVVSDSSQDRFR